MRNATSILIMTLALSAPAFAADSTTNFKFDTKGLTSLRLEHPVGDLTVRGADVSAVEVRMTVSCRGRGCAEKVAKIKLLDGTRGGDLRLEVDGYPKWGGNLNVDLEIRMPRNLAVNIDHGVGQTDIEGLLADIKVEAGVGEVEIRSLASAFRSAKIDAAVGEADLEVSGRTISGGSHFIGGDNEWNGGQGKSRLDLEVGVGSASVTFE